jgi:hypothetical protein
MTTHQAKKIVLAKLEAGRLKYTKVTARTINFTDLARDSKVFVQIHGWTPNPKWNDLEHLAHQHGFCIEAGL